MLHICKEFGWTYREYMETPTWVLNLIVAKMSYDNKLTKRNGR